MSVRDDLADIHEDLIFADGYDEAIVGIVERCGMQPVVCYDVTKCIDILVQEGLPYEEAVEYFHFNVTGAYVGPNTPMWLTTTPVMLADAEPTDPDQQIPSED